jgi:hypothetical protein
MERTMMSLRRRAVLAMALSGIGLAGVAKAQVPYDLVDVTVVDRETGQPLRVWRRDGRLFVAGQPGARYSLRVTNHTGGRVLVVMSVDGVNILTGETAGYGQSGYVFDPYQSYDVSGWRKSDSEVAAFAFARLSQSYAARTGRPGDVGVIGIAAFRERFVPPPMAVAPLAESRARPSADSASVVEESVVTGRRAAAPPAAPQRRVEEKLGTAHGAREWSAVTTVGFERATAYPQLIRRIEYDTYDNLVASGVIRPSRPPAHRPRPFPSSPDGAGYVPDPPGGP